MKKKNKVLVLIAILVFILIIISIMLNAKKVNDNEGQQTVDTTYFENSSINKLAEFSEKERVMFYFSQYIENIENGDYNNAYKLLYDEFKNTYFDTIEKFESYVSQKYPEIILVDYISFQREGVYYIVTVKIEDIVTGESFEQKFVIREYDYNNFVLSFQAE